MKYIGNRNEKNFYLHSLGHLVDLPMDLAVVGNQFGLFIAMDAREFSDLELRRLASHCLDQGAAYVSVWGPDCERLHDIFDLCIIAAAPQATVDDVICTTWHAKESLDEALQFVRIMAEPARAYEFTCHSWLILVVGSVEWTEEITESLSPTSDETEE